jgi:hypothetical protein
MFRVPTATVAPVPTWAGIRTLVTVLKALVPFIVPVEAIVVMNDSVIILPSTFVPVTTTELDWTADAVPPIVTESTLGTSGFVIPDVTVWALPLALVAASTAVVEAAATFF